MKFKIHQYLFDTTLVVHQTKPFALNHKLILMLCNYNYTIVKVDENIMSNEI